MREIKFRGYHEIAGWVAGSYRTNYDDHHAIADRKLQIEYFVKKESVGQYTGLKDKNGVEIYEGDILNEPTSPVGGKDGGYKYTAREIKWQGAGRGYNLFAPYAASEVIGNIYENPELLESNNE